MAAAEPKGGDALVEMSPEQQQQIENALKTAGNVVFPTHKPRDALYGLKSGVYNIGSGVVTGATALVTAPIIGAKTDGVRGFAAGLGVGLVSAVALPIAGVVNGTRQMVRGCINTAEAVDAHMSNKVWDPKEERWKPFVPYSLKTEAEEILGNSAAASEGQDGSSQRRRDPSHRVADMYYYDLLKVSSDATAGEVKKGYYKEARRCHPDRNPDDPEAHNKFQALGEAYRVLSSDQLRAYYDKYGRDEKDAKGGVDAEMQMEMAKLFFAVLFGGERFEPYIGQLGVSSVVDALVQEGMAQAMGSGSAGAGMTGLNIDEMKAAQTKREVQCAVDLAARLQPYVDAREDEFNAFVAKEVQDMSKATFGEPLLHAIGSSYTLCAQKCLGYHQSFLGVEGHITAMRMKGRSVSAYADVARKGVDSLNRVKEMVDLSEEEKKKAQKAMILPEPPTKEELQAKEESYMALPIKELRATCSSRTPPVSTVGCLEKKEVVDRLMRDDQRVFMEELDQVRSKQAAAASSSADESELSPEAQARLQEAMDRSLPTFMQTMVSASLVDVENTLKAACNKVVKDTSVPEETRIRRAQAMLLMGRAFSAARGTTKAARGEVQAKQMFEGTMAKTMAKAQGQEVHDDDEFVVEEQDPAPTAGGVETPPTAGAAEA